jgi:hypothetical protein
MFLNECTVDLTNEFQSTSQQMEHTGCQHKNSFTHRFFISW